MKNQETYKIEGTLERRIDQVDLILASGNVDLNLDFEQVMMISVEGLEWLEELLLRAKSHGTTVSFSNVRPEQYKVFKVAHIDSLLEACGALGRSGPAC
jgi:anti-anti-sigma regulatory factor